MNKIFLGSLREDNEPIYITKHSWDCGWYWGLGYVGNKNQHFHFDSFLRGNTYLASDIFDKPTFTDTQWWVIRDLFVQAYALKAAAEVYRYGGHQTSLTGVTDVIKNIDMATTINDNLKTVLDTVWDYMTKIVEVKSVKN